MADNIFTDEQLYLIRDIIGDVCTNHVERGDIDCAEEELEIINAIQRHFDDPEYVNTKHFVQDGALGVRFLTMPLIIIRRFD